MSKFKMSGVQKSWAFYDWANSVYPLVITTAIFPLFYEAVTPEHVSFWGVTWINTELYSYILAASFLLVAILSPLLSGIADVKGSQKQFLRFFCFLGSISCMALFWFEKQLGVGLLSIFLASIGFWGSLVFYNAYLPQIATVNEQDALSARGFTLGYIGSSVLLIVLLVCIMVLDMPAKWSFLVTGIWWMGFAQITLFKLPQLPALSKVRWYKGFTELAQVWKRAGEVSGLRLFLLSFWVYSMGVQTVMIMATLFGAKEIVGMPDSGLIISVLIIQFIAAIGAELCSSLARRFGGISVLKWVVFSWVFICVIAYFIWLPAHFYVLAALVGLIMGGVQSLSRSTYSKLIPGTNSTASFFSFYDVTEKLGIVVGMVAYGWIEGLTGNMRNSILALISFFVVGFILLHWTSKKVK